MRFGGFKDSVSLLFFSQFLTTFAQDFEKIKSFSNRHWNQDVEEKQYTLKGFNYGKTKVDGTALQNSEG